MTEAAVLTSRIRSDDLNRHCFCLTLDRQALCRAIDRETGDPGFCATHVRPRQHLFSNVPVFLPEADIAAMQDVVAAIHAVAALPAYREKVLSWAPEIARADHGPRGVFMGFDFHLDAAGPKLIEINTNAGGAFLNAVLSAAHRACCIEMDGAPELRGGGDFARAVASMFEAEWRRQGIGRPLTSIVITDDEPQAQYLYPEFVLARELLGRASYQVMIADPSRFRRKEGRLILDGLTVDLVYNRLVDFALEDPAHQAMRAAYASGDVAVTPNPHSHALFADKRNLVLLSDPEELEAMGVAAGLREKLRAVPRTVRVTEALAGDLWQQRKHLYFKPAGGHGSKAVYRGDKVTRGVFAEIVGGAYVAQDFAPPGERMMKVDGVPAARKVDVRIYTYDGRMLLAAARLYQGQATNFRTPGGGFAPVFAVGETGQTAQSACC